MLEVVQVRAGKYVASDATWVLVCTAAWLVAALGDDRFTS